MQLRQLDDAFDHVGKALAPLLIRTCPAEPAPTFWNAPVAVVPPARMPYAVVEATPVPPRATTTVLKPAPNAPLVSVPVPVMLLYAPGVRSALVINAVDSRP